MLFIWLINDSFLKAHFPSFITGKLSDIAGLYLFPLFLTWILSIFVSLIQKHSFNEKKEFYIYLFSTTTTCFVFVMLNVSQEINERLTCILWGFFSDCQNLRGVADYTDLFTLPIIFYAYHSFKKNKDERQANKEITFAVILLISLAFINTSQPRKTSSRMHPILLFLLSAGGGCIELISPLDEAILIQNENINFKWNYKNSRESNPTPSNMNYPSLCGEPTKVAGTFKEYELTIYSDKELTDKKISFNTGNNNYDYTISFAPGKYYWITTLLFENHANCATKKYNVTLSRASSFTIK